jgi:hypothetical protein
LVILIFFLINKIFVGKNQQPKYTITPDICMGKRGKKRRNVSCFSMIEIKVYK